MLMLWAVEAALLVSCVVLMAYLLDALEGAPSRLLMSHWYAWALGLACGTAWMLGVLLVTA